MAKCEDASYDGSSAADPVAPETASEDVDTERGALESDALERQDTTATAATAATSAVSNNPSEPPPGDEFEMWDYVCPQYARRFYASEWV